MTNSQALKAVREMRGLDIGDVASTTSISLARLNSFEVGELEPSRKQVDRLSEIYGVPTYSLYAQGIPNLPPLPVDFRNADLSAASISSKGMKTLWASEKISYFTRQLIGGLNYQPVDFLSEVKKANSNKARATKLRNVFDEWLGPRASKLNFSGPHDQQFLSSLRLFFEVQGGVININDAPADDYYGFFLDPEGGVPTIFVNRKIQSKKAQLFTLAHEFSHFLNDAPGISNPYELKNNIERSCNIFAAEFLAPMERFSRLAENIPIGIRKNISEYISAVSSQSLLSKHAAAIRLVEGGYISQQDLRKWARSWTKFPRIEKEEEKATSAAVSGGQPHATRIGVIGHLPIYLAYLGNTAGFIDKYDVINGIGLSETLQERAYNLAARRIEIANS